VIPHAHFTGGPITQEFPREALKNLLIEQEKKITTGNIQKTVSDFFMVSISDLLFSPRTRSIIRPRRIAMTLAKQLTAQSRTIMQ